MDYLRLSTTTSQAQGPFIELPTFVGDPAGIVAIQDTLTIGRDRVVALHLEEPSRQALRTRWVRDVDALIVDIAFLTNASDSDPRLGGIQDRTASACPRPDGYAERRGHVVATRAPPCGESSMVTVPNQSVAP